MFTFLTFLFALWMAYWAVIIAVALLGVALEHPVITISVLLVGAMFLGVFADP